MILHIVLKSGAPGLLEDELNHDSIAVGPSDAEFEADEVEKREETGEEASEDEVPSPSSPPVRPKDNYSPATWNHPLPEPLNNLPLLRLDACKLLLATTPPLETPTTSVLLHSTTVDQRLCDISASNSDSRTLLLVRGRTSGKTSNDVTFCVTGTAIGTNSIIYWRAGANPHTYSKPLAGSTAVERKHMPNTVQIGSTPLDVAEKEVKQYVFSVEDAREDEHCLKVLRTQIHRAAANALESE